MLATTSATAYNYLMTFRMSLETQPNFPLVDLTEGNAATLEIMLGNALFVEQGHELAERTTFAFRTGHPTTVFSAKQLFDGTYVAAIEHGVTMLEAIYTSVSGGAAEADTLRITSSARSMLLRAQQNCLLDGALTAFETFRTEMPRTTEVISNTSHRFFGPLTERAVFGAALERQIIIDASHLLPN